MAQPPFHIQDMFVYSLGSCPTLTEYLRARVNNVVIHSSEYKRPEKTCSKYVKMRDGTYCEVKHIFSFDGPSIAFVCQELITSDSRFGTAHLQICRHPPPNEQLCLFFEHDFSFQCVFIEQCLESYISHVPNCYEKD